MANETTKGVPYLSTNEAELKIKHDKVSSLMRILESDYASDETKRQAQNAIGGILGKDRSSSYIIGKTKEGADPIPGADDQIIVGGKMVAADIREKNKDIFGINEVVKNKATQYVTEGRIAESDLPEGSVRTGLTAKELTDMNVHNSTKIGNPEIFNNESENQEDPLDQSALPEKPTGTFIGKYEADSNGNKNLIVIDTSKCKSNEQVEKYRKLGFNEAVVAQAAKERVADTILEEKPGGTKDVVNNAVFKGLTDAADMTKFRTDVESGLETGSKVVDKYTNTHYRDIPQAASAQLFGKGYMESDIRRLNAEAIANSYEVPNQSIEYRKSEDDAFYTANGKNFRVDSTKISDECKKYVNTLKSKDIVYKSDKVEKIEEDTSKKEDLKPSDSKPDPNIEIPYDYDSDQGELTIAGHKVPYYRSAGTDAIKYPIVDQYVDIMGLPPIFPNNTNSVDELGKIIPLSNNASTNAFGVAQDMMEYKYFDQLRGSFPILKIHPIDFGLGQGVRTPYGGFNDLKDAVARDKYVMTDVEYRFAIDSTGPIQYTHTNQFSESSIEGTVKKFTGGLGAMSQLQQLRSTLSGMGSKFVDDLSKATEGALTALETEANDWVKSAMADESMKDYGGILEVVNQMFHMGKDVIKNGRIDMPDVWIDSNTSNSHSFTIKLRTLSPDPRSKQYFADILLPLYVLLTLALPTEGQTYLYKTPSYITATLDDSFWEVKLGAITSLSWTIETSTINFKKVPTHIDIQLTIQDMYKVMSQESFDATNKSTVTGHNRDLMTKSEYIDNFVKNFPGGPTGSSASDKIKVPNEAYYLTEFSGYRSKLEAYVKQKEEEAAEAQRNSTENADKGNGASKTGTTNVNADGEKTGTDAPSTTPETVAVADDASDIETPTTDAETVDESGIETPTTNAEASTSSAGGKIKSGKETPNTQKVVALQKDPVTKKTSFVTSIGNAITSVTNNVKNVVAGNNSAIGPVRELINNGKTVLNTANNLKSAVKTVGNTANISSILDGSFLGSVGAAFDNIGNAGKVLSDITGGAIDTSKIGKNIVDGVSNIAQKILGNDLPNTVSEDGSKVSLSDHIKNAISTVRGVGNAVSTVMNAVSSAKNIVNSSSSSDAIGRLTGYMDAANSIINGVDFVDRILNETKKSAVKHDCYGAGEIASNVTIQNKLSNNASLIAEDAATWANMVTGDLTLNYLKKQPWFKNGLTLKPGKTGGSLDDYQINASNVDPDLASKMDAAWATIASGTKNFTEISGNIAKDSALAGIANACPDATTTVKITSN